MDEEIRREIERQIKKEYEEIDEIIGKYKLYYHFLEHEMYDLIMQELEDKTSFYFGTMIKVVDALMYNITDVDEEELDGEVFILYENAYFGSRCWN